MQSKDLVVMDSVWGEIVIEDRFLPIVNSLTFRSLRDKKQLGLLAKDGRFLGGQHTRYDHSIGTFHLAKVLINKCRAKGDEKEFWKHVQISQKEEDAFLLAALLHDSGHGPFSHIFERLSSISHEEATFRIIESGEIHDLIVENFGEDMPERVLKILKDKERVKRSQGEIPEFDDIDFTFIISALMSGAIDVDRLDYLSRDTLSVKRERVDFTSILDGMDIDVVDDVPVIVFDYNTLSTLEKYFIHRFNSYNEMYFADSTLVLDEIFVKFIKCAFEEDKITSNLSESTINALLHDVANGNVKNYPFEIQRYARLLSTGPDNQVLHRTFRCAEERAVFEAALKELIPFDDLDDLYFSTVKRSVSVYNKKKNTVYIKDGDEVVDISDISPFIRNDIKKDTILSIVDLDLLKYAMEKEHGFDEAKINKTVKHIKKLFNAKNIEIEKKFTFAEEIDYFKEFESICSMLGAEPKGEALNEDMYYQDPEKKLNLLKSAVRFRVSEKDNGWTVKLPAQDSTSLSKRQEHKYESEIPVEGILNIVNGLLQKDFKENIVQLNEFLKIRTERKKYLLEYKGSTIEIVLDKSRYQGKQEVEDMMIEAEVTKGSPVALWLLTRRLQKHFNLIPCEESKLERATRMTMA